MAPVTSAFALEVFDRRRARSDRLAEFLSIYVQHFGPEHRTPTNELVEFLLSPVKGQSIFYFGLTYDGKPCGFATFMHYPDGPIGVIDHLVVAPNLRGFGGFFMFCDLIAKYLEEKRIPIDHLVSEVTLSHPSSTPTIRPAILVRMMRLVGFKAVRSAYWAPDPAILEDVDSCRAALLLASQPERDDLPASEFARIVELIYRTHYGLWYERTMTKEKYERYRQVSEKLLLKIQSSVAKEKRVVLNGMKNFDLVFSLDPSPRPDPSTLFYVGLIALPAAVGLAVGFAQELKVAAIATTISIIIIALFATNRKLRGLLMRAFQLK